MEGPQRFPWTETEMQLEAAKVPESLNAPLWWL